MKIDLKAGIVRILSPDGATAGTGFIISDNQIITCAHVVEKARDMSTGSVRVEFLQGKVENNGIIEDEYYRGVNNEDVAFLRIQNKLPVGATALVLGPSLKTGGLKFKTFGFPKPKAKRGMWGYGVVGDATQVEDGDHPVLQLTASDEITSGFSGAPIMLTESESVIGMVTSITSPDKYGRLRGTTFATPTETLIAICPALYFDKPKIGQGVLSQRELQPVFSFPNVPSHFVARQEELTKAKRILLRKDKNAITIYGMAGVGKTTLASRILDKIKNRFPGGALWADFPAHGGDPLPIMYSWAQLCEHPEIGSIVSPQIRAQAIARILAEYVEANGRIIAVFDDVRETADDPWLEGAQLLKTAMPRGTPLLLTTRQVEVSAALQTEFLPLDVLSADMAMDLLYQWGISSRATANRLATAVGYLPLALEILAAVVQVEGLDWVELNLKRPHTRLSVLRSGELKNKENNVRASFELSYSALGDAEKVLFRLLGGFAAGEIKREWIGGLINQSSRNGINVKRNWESLLRNLRHRSLTNKTLNGYRLHPLIHDFAYLLLMEHDPQEVIRKAHQKYFLQRLRAEKHNFDEIALMFENLNTATQYAFHKHQWFELKDFIINLATSSRYLYIRGLWQEALRLLLMGVKGAIQNKDVTTQALLLCEVGTIRRESANHKAALAAFNQAIDLCQDENDSYNLASALMGKGFVFLYSGKYREAKQILQRAIQVAQYGKNVIALGEALRALGRVEFSMGNFVSARGYLDKALSIHRKSNHKQGIAYTFTALGKVTAFEGDPKTALELFSKALILVRQLGDLQSQGYILRGMGDVYKSIGDFDRALSLYVEAGDSYNNTRDLAGLASLNCNKGEILVRLNQIKSARRSFTESARLAAKASVPRWQTRSVFGEALCEYAEGNNEHAGQLAARALRKFQQMRHRDAAMVRTWLKEKCPD